MRRKFQSSAETESNRRFEFVALFEEDSMYKTKKKNYAIIAIIYFIVMLFGYLVMGVLYKCGVEYYSIILWLLLIVAVLIVIIKDKSIINLGFTRKKIKWNALFAGIIITVTIIFAFLFTDRSANIIIKAVFYYLIFIY